MMPSTIAKPQPTAPAPDPQRVAILNATNRCIIERCGAQAYVRVVMMTDPDDVFDYCAHHFVERVDKIMAVAKYTHDERWRLEEVAKLDVSA